MSLAHQLAATALRSIGTLSFNPVYVALAIIVGTWLVVWLHPATSKLDSIPAIGHSGPISSYITAIKYTWDSQNIIDEGYLKYKGGLFKIPMLGYWLVVATDSTAVEDIRQAPEDTLSFNHALWKFLETDYTVGHEMRLNPYHVELIRTVLTRNLAAIFHDIYDEVTKATARFIPIEDDWVSHPAASTLMKIVCQTSNRVLVGSPTCRNLDYQDVNIHYSLEIVKALVPLMLLPSWLKPIAAPVFSNIKSSIQRCARHLEPLVKERFDIYISPASQECGDKPNDMLMWCMGEARGDEKNMENLSRRILLVNFGAIHMTTTSFTFALQRVASYPECVPILRREIEMVVAEEGWSRSALNKMVKLDSFLKETGRLDSPGVWAMQRLALKPFTFSNGSTVPAGTMIACPVAPLQCDESYHGDAKQFRPWRFCDLPETEPANKKQQFTSTGPDYIAFGHGKRACPGRFFASVLLKTLLAHILVTYDVKYEDKETCPAKVYIASACVPGEGNLMFRKRQD